MTTGKLMTHDDVVARLRSGMTIAIGGWASRRKPMSLVRAIARSDLTDLTIVTHGGPDLGLLCAAGKVRRAVYAFASLDSIPLEPHFRAARQSGAIEDEPLDEGLFHLGLQAAAWRVPFLPSRVGLGSDLLRHNPRLRTFRSPFPQAGRRDGEEPGEAPGGEGGDPGERGEELVAMPALEPDAAICHLNRADARGNAMFLGPDLYWDDLMLQAAPTGRRFISAERVVPTADLAAEGCIHQMRISRMMVDGVVEAPGGAHPTLCAPDYPRDEAAQREYAAAAGTPEAWEAYRAAWVAVPEEEYQRKLREGAA
ncbi:MAG: CoA transferase subunit A [Acidimicrobiia bacterium]